MEDPNNIGYVCKEHSSRPDPKLTKLPPEHFIGKFVKLGFAGKLPNGRETIEHMWVKVSGVEKGELIGTLDNIPILEMEYAYGEELAFRTDEIEAVEG